MQSYLLTYNPDSPEWVDQEGKNRLLREIEDVNKGRPIRWNCAKKVVRGDRGLLLRLGIPQKNNPDVRGIFGLAEAISDAVPDNGKGQKRRHFACWKVSRIVNPEKVGPIIPIRNLDARFENMDWHPQKIDGRTFVPEHIADKLAAEILAGRG